VDPEPVVRAAARRYPFPEQYVREYLSRLRFGFGSDERSGLEVFLSSCRRMGLLHAVPSHA